MIRKFNRACLMFPVRWANSVSAWISGICSPSGTIRIKNNLSPLDGPSVMLDVDVEVLFAKMRERLDKEYVRKDALRDIVDETSLMETNGLLSVRSEYVRRIARGNA